MFHHPRPAPDRHRRDGLRPVDFERHRHLPVLPTADLNRHPQHVAPPRGPGHTHRPIAAGRVRPPPPTHPHRRVELPQCPPHFRPPRVLRPPIPDPPVADHPHLRRPGRRSPQMIRRGDQQPRHVRRRVDRGELRCKPQFPGLGHTPRPPLRRPDQRPRPPARGPRPRHQRFPRRAQPTDALNVDGRHRRRLIDHRHPLPRTRRPKPPAPGQRPSHRQHQRDQRQHPRRQNQPPSQSGVPPVDRVGRQQETHRRPWRRSKPPTVEQMHDDRGRRQRQRPQQPRRQKRHRDPARRRVKKFANTAPGVTSSITRW